MAHYLLYIPTETDTTRVVLGRYGLAELLRVGEPDPQIAGLDGPGPDGQPGGLLVLPYRAPGVSLDNDPNPELAFLPDRQTWHQCVQHGYWLGWETDNRPKPSDLQRADALDGADPEMADGQRWTIPNVFAQQHVADVDDNGNLTSSSRYVHEELYRAALPMLERCEQLVRFQAGVKGSEDTWSNEESFDYVCGLLTRNYRVNRFIVGKLGLIDIAKLASFVALGTDYNRLSALEWELQQGELPAPS